MANVKYPTKKKSSIYVYVYMVNIHLQAAATS